MATLQILWTKRGEFYGSLQALTVLVSPHAVNLEHTEVFILTRLLEKHNTRISNARHEVHTNTW
jgi:hypothetical protein